MEVMEFPFKILTICGCWRPKSWTTPRKRLLYFVYTIVLLIVLYLFTLSQLIDLIVVGVENTEDFTDHFYILVAMIVSCCKMSSLLLNRDNIKMLIDILTTRPCKPIETDEIEIQQKFDKLIQMNTFLYAILIGLTCLCITMISLLTQFSKRDLTFRAWFPFDYFSSALFYVVYAFQLIGLTVGGFLHVACECIICGLLVNICCQMKMIECRLRKIARDPNILRECVLQHNHIFKFTNLINEKFRFTFVVQFAVSTLVVCLNLFEFTKSTISKTQYMQLIMYMSCTLSQIFFYCWYGNEVKLQSRELANNIFEMEWFQLDEYTKKSLLIIMKRSTISIELNSVYVISMNLDSFVGLLKTSYSAYNLMKQV